MQIGRFAPCPLWAISGDLSAFLWCPLCRQKQIICQRDYPRPLSAGPATTYPSENMRQAKQGSPGGCPRGFRAGPTILARAAEADSTVLGNFGRKSNQASSVHELLILAQIMFDRLT